MTALARVQIAVGGSRAGAGGGAPMAVVILGGLFTATLLNLFLPPPLYLRYGQRRSREATVGGSEGRGPRRARLRGGVQRPTYRPWRPVVAVGLGVGSAASAANAFFCSSLNLGREPESMTLPWSEIAWKFNLSFVSSMSMKW